MECEFFREIDFPEALELITEKFDNAVDLMGSNAVVYGGAIRDLIAGFPITSDLDIACSYHGHIEVVKAFDNSEKWTREKPHKTNNNDSSIKTLLKNPFIKDNNPSRYPYEKMQISSVINFYTCNNVKVQLMRAAARLSETKTATDVVRGVDIACCGLMMDAAGRIFEVIDGAYRDCIDRVLKLNKENPNVDIEALKYRVNKLESRGWISKINMHKLTKNINKLKESKEKYAQKLANQLQAKAQKDGIYWCEFVVTDEEFIVRVFKDSIDNYIGAKLAPEQIEGIITAAEPKKGLCANYTKIKPDYVEKSYSRREINFPYQIRDFKSKLHFIVNEHRKVVQGKIEGKTSVFTNRPAEMKFTELATSGGNKFARDPRGPAAYRFAGKIRDIAGSDKLVFAKNNSPIMAIIDEICDEPDEPRDIDMPAKLEVNKVNVYSNVDMPKKIEASNNALILEGGIETEYHTTFKPFKPWSDYKPWTDHEREELPDPEQEESYRTMIDENKVVPLDSSSETQESKQLTKGELAKCQK